MSDQLRSPATGWTLAAGGPGYPAWLLASPRPPRTLYGFGDTALLRPGIAIVGSRRATPYGLACARTFAGWAASRGVVVISGAAYGCDRAAHEAALEAGGRTVAVLGCGADVDYPRSGAALLRTLRARHAVVSELPWGAPPATWTFPERNRIIAALAAVLLVVEAMPRSGTFSTVDHALDAGREVCVVPGSILSDTSRGCNSLLQQGAQPITGTDDLAAVLFSARLLDRDSALGEIDRPWATHRTTDRRDPVASRVAAALLANPMRTDDAARALDLDIATVARAVSRLERDGIVARHVDGRYGACRSP